MDNQSTAYATTYKTPYREQYKKWVWYLTKNRSDSTLTTTDKHRLSLAEYFYKLQVEQGYILYHLTLTYKPCSDSNHRPENFNRFFIHFHTRYFLQLLLGTKNIHFAMNKKIQPKVMAFLDEHLDDKFTSSHQPSRLHHHAIFAVHPSHKKIMDNYLGENTFNLVGHQNSPYMTSFLNECEPMRVLYASKMYDRYPEFLSFPDKMSRSRHKYRMTKHNRTSTKDAEKCFYKFPNVTKTKFLEANRKKLLHGQTENSKDLFLQENFRT